MVGEATLVLRMMFFLINFSGANLTIIEVAMYVCIVYRVC